METPGRFRRQEEVRDVVGVAAATVTVVVVVVVVVVVFFFLSDSVFSVGTWSAC